jgi:hypothetical protein
MRVEHRLRNGCTAVAAYLAIAGCDSPSTGSPKLDHFEVDGDQQIGTVGAQLPDPIVVRAVDASGRPVAGVAVKFIVLDDGAVSAPEGQTTAEGRVVNRWTLGTAAGPQVLEVQAADPITGLLRRYLQFSAVGQAAAPAELVTPVGTTLYAEPGGSAAPAVLLRDAFGNPAPGATVAWSVVSGGGQADPTQSVTGTDGIARTLWHLADGTALQRLAASVPGTSGVEFTGLPVTEETVDAAVYGNKPLWLPAGSESGINFRVVGDGGTPVANYPVSFTTTGGSSTTVPSARTNENGDVTVPWRMPNASAVQTITIHAGTASGTHSATSYLPDEVAAIQVDLGSRIRMFQENGGFFYAGERIEAAVRVTNPGGNPAVGAVVDWAILDGSSRFEQLASTVDASGVSRNVLLVDTVSGGFTSVRISSGGAQLDGRFEILADWIVAVRVTPDSLGLRAGGGEAQLYGTQVDRFGNTWVYDYVGGRSRPGIVTSATSTEPSVATVRYFTYGNGPSYIYVTPVSVGTAYVIYSGAGVGSDTATVRVDP